MKDILIKFNLKQRDSKKIPDLRAGDIVKVHRKIKEGGKERIQIFEGIIIAIKGKQSSSPTITVRKVSNGVGVELVLPIYSPSIDKIELVKRAKVRRSKLYYIRDKSAKALRLKYKDMAEFAKVEEETPEEDVAVEEKDGGEGEVEKEKKAKDEKKTSENEASVAEKKKEASKEKSSGDEDDAKKEKKKEDK